MILDKGKKNRRTQIEIRENGKRNGKERTRNGKDGQDKKGGKQTE